MMERKLGIQQVVESTGIINEYDVEDNDRVRFVSENANPANTFIIRAKLRDQSSWTDIVTLSGSSEVVQKIDTYELIQIECTVLDGTNVRLIASGFEDGC